MHEHALETHPMSHQPLAPTAPGRTWTSGRAWLLALVLCWPAAGWSYTCQLLGQSYTVLVNEHFGDADQQISVRCTRTIGESVSLWYRITADLGSRPTSSQPFRSAESAGGQRMSYALSRLNIFSKCSDTTNWLADATGDDNVIHGSILFYPAWRTETTFIFPYCLRGLPLAGSNRMAAPGTYVDQFQVKVEFLGSGSPLVPGVAHTPLSLMMPVVIQVVGYCKVSTPRGLQFEYRAFSRIDSTSMGKAGVACSQGLVWSASLDSNSGTLLGLDYSLSIERPGDIGNGREQILDIRGRIPAGQAGTCAGATCTGTRSHTLNVTY